MQSFFYKGKQVPAAEIAREPSLVYLLDGSVQGRRQGARLPAFARAENGYVIWTENDDRPQGDLLMVQDEIADEVAKALRASIGGETQPAASGK